LNQRTISNPLLLEGVGIHTGAPCRIVVHPAEPDTGRRFETSGVTVPAQTDYVVDTARCTTLGHEGVRVSTVEHLLSALYGCGIDNARIEVFGPEIPILDGSAQPFVEAIEAAGIQVQARPAHTIRLTEPIEMCEGASRLIATPAETFTVEVHTEFTNWTEGQAVARAEAGPEFMAQYATEIAPARTFAFRHEVEALVAAGLAKGGSLDNALVITPPDTFSTPLRLPREWCVHKLLDVLGDLALLDARPCFHLTALRPGHRANVRLAAKIQGVGSRG
jgi:UDP-3-O-[3-hydroxymyristoyl] N-acetylglucosamine deacetylase